MTLTEQWNKGKLPEGDYYIKRRNGYLPYDNIDSRGVWHNSIDEDIIEVLAPVPSYEEWRDLEDDLATCDKDLNNVCEQKEELYEENQQLKELLKECRNCVTRQIYGSPTRQYFEGVFDNELLTKIDSAIGEK